MLEQHGLAPDVHTKVGELLPLGRLNAFLDDAALRIGDPMLGFWIGEHLPPGTYAAVEFAARTSPNLREAFEQLVRYARVLNPSACFELKIDANGDGALHYSIVGEPKPSAIIHEHTATVVTRFAQQVAAAFVPVELAFAHARPSEMALEAARRFGCPVRFAAGGATASIRVTAAQLATPLRMASAPLHQFLEIGR